MASNTDSKVQFKEEAICELCGKYGAYIFNGKTLCADCYETTGSCCPEFGPTQDDSSRRSGSSADF